MASFSCCYGDQGAVQRSHTVTGKVKLKNNVLQEWVPQPWSQEPYLASNFKWLLTVKNTLLWEQAAKLHFHPSPSFPSWWREAGLGLGMRLNFDPKCQLTRFHWTSQLQASSHVLLGSKFSIILSCSFNPSWASQELTCVLAHNLETQLHENHLVSWMWAECKEHTNAFTVKF